MSENEASPITAPVPATDQALSLVRAIVLSISVITAFAGFLSKRDLNGFVAYVQSNDFLAWLAMMSAAGTLWWSQWRARHRAKQIVAIRDDPRVPDTVVK